MNVCPSCRPPEETKHYTYVITVVGKELSGTLELRIDPSVEDTEDGARPRNLSYKVVGTKKQLRPDQQIFDQKAAVKAFKERYRDFLHECDFDNRRKREVSVRLVVGSDGSLKSILFDGREQDPKANCMDQHLPFIENFFPNTTGRVQSVMFLFTVGE